VEPLVGSYGTEETATTFPTTSRPFHTTTTTTTMFRYRPYLCSLDMIGAQSPSRSTACAGAATQSLYGTAQALWRENLSPAELVQVCGQAFISATERGSRLSDYGGGWDCGIRIGSHAE